MSDNRLESIQSRMLVVLALIIILVIIFFSVTTSPFRWTKPTVTPTPSTPTVTLLPPTDSPTPTTTLLPMPSTPTVTPTPSMPTVTQTTTLLPTTNTPISPTASTTPEVVIQAFPDVTATTLGQIDLDYPKVMFPNTSDTVIVRIYIPEKLVSLVPIKVDRVELPADVPKILGEYDTQQFTIYISPTMRVELISSDFKITNLYRTTQTVDTQHANRSTVWSWTIQTFNKTGRYILTISVYLGQDDNPSWLRNIAITVAEPTPTPTLTPIPTATSTPSPTATFTPTPLPTATFTPTPIPLLTQAKREIITNPLPYIAIILATILIIFLIVLGFRLSNLNRNDLVIVFYDHPYLAKHYYPKMRRDTSKNRLIFWLIKSLQIRVIVKLIIKR